VNEGLRGGGEAVLILRAVTVLVSVVGKTAGCRAARRFLSHFLEAGQGFHSKLICWGPELELQSDLGRLSCKWGRIFEMVRYLQCKTETRILQGINKDKVHEREGGLALFQPKCGLLCYV
jgi:hypothetical protein